MNIARSNFSQSVLRNFAVYVASMFLLYDCGDEINKTSEECSAHVIYIYASDHINSNIHMICCLIEELF